MCERQRLWNSSFRLQNWHQVCPHASDLCPPSPLSTAPWSPRREDVSPVSQLPSTSPPRRACSRVSTTGRTSELACLTHASWAAARLLKYRQISQQPHPPSSRPLWDAMWDPPDELGRSPSRERARGCAPKRGPPGQCLWCHCQPLAGRSAVRRESGRLAKLCWSKKADLKPERPCTAQASMVSGRRAVQWGPRGRLRLCYCDLFFRVPKT